MKSIVRGGIDD